MAMRWIRNNPRRACAITAVSMAAILLATFLTIGNSRKNKKTRIIDVKSSVELNTSLLLLHDPDSGDVSFAALVSIYNHSDEPVWYYGLLPMYQVETNVDGEVSRSTVITDLEGEAPYSRVSKLCSQGTLTILAGPISENVDSFRVGVPFVADNKTLDTATWIFTPEVTLTEREGYYFPQEKMGAMQTRQVFDLSKEPIDFPEPPIETETIYPPM